MASENIHATTAEDPEALKLLDAAANEFAERHLQTRRGRLLDKGLAYTPPPFYMQPMFRDYFLDAIMMLGEEAIK